jgi:hypothetical protein
LQRRYAALVNCHMQSAQSLAAGIHAVPDASASFATTLAAHRFLNNERVTLPALAEPLIESVRQEAPRECERFLLVAHDWSQLMYADHLSKKDRARLSSRGEPDGYELQSALAMSDRDGSPLAPLAMSLRAADGVHCSRDCQPRQALSPLDELEPTMRYIEERRLPLPAVHIIDAEADSVAHFREWSGQPNRWYLVRADDRLVAHQGDEQKCSALRAALHERQRFRYEREVLYHGRKASQWIAEAPVTLLRAGQRNRPAAGDRKRIAGVPLDLRLVISEVRDPQGVLLATWYLLTNLPEEVVAGDVALWYYWRWRIETYFKLMKSAGLNAESWQQETAAAIARRLLVASMACATVWRLARSTHPQAAPARRLLVRLSGRQMKHKQEFTIPAMLAGLWTLLSMIEVLNHYSLDEIRELAASCLATASPFQPP